MYVLAAIPENRGSSKDPLQESVVGLLDQTINPGDKVFTFTQVYGKGTRICSGIFRGVVKKPWGKDGKQHWNTYIVERACGKRTILQYPGIVLDGTTLADLDELEV